MQRDKSDTRISFESAAAALECDGDEASFNAALGKIAQAKPIEPPTKKPKPDKAKPAH